MRAGGPRQDSLDASQYGVHYGIVVQNKDPDGLDRIKVRFPWLDNGDTDQSHWCQLLTPMEGNKFGFYSMPDIEDCVLIIFIAGDSSQPVAIGGVWSTPDFSPETNEDGANNFRGYRSRSGHRMVLDDSSNTKVYIADKTAKNMIGVGKFDKAGAGPNVCAIYKPPMSGDSGISVSTMEGKMELTAKEKLIIKAQQSIKLNIKTTIDMKVGTDIQMEGSSAAKLTASDNFNYDAPSVNLE
jgi:uncharacterized protein involved in type VI secretion and phage assembly